MGDYSLAGAVFEVLDSQGVVVDSVTTDASGQAQSKLLKLGNYTVKERTAPYGFVRNSATFTVNLVYAGQDVECAYAPVNCHERPQSGIIRVTKTNTNPAMGDYALNGAVFEIRNATGTLVDTISTNSQGKAQTKELPLGAYTVTEKTAPHGYVRNKSTFHVSLVYAGQDVEITYGDATVGERPQTGKITVTKRDIVTGDVAQGDATLNGAVFEILASDQKTVLDTIFCGATDKVTSKELPLGTYYITNVNNLRLQVRFEIKIKILMKSRMGDARARSTGPNRRNATGEGFDDIWVFNIETAGMPTEGSENESVAQGDDQIGGACAAEMLELLAFLSLHEPLALVFELLDLGLNVVNFLNYCFYNNPQFLYIILLNRLEII